MKKISLVSTLFLSAVLLTGCFGDDSEKDKKNNYSKVTQPAGSNFTVLDLKNKYGETEKDESKILPFYNVSSDQIFKFDFSEKALYELPTSELVSVHTDIKALPESEILSFKNVQHHIKDGGGYTLEVKPATGVLANESTKKKEGTSWGNAPIYYLNIKYDFKTGKKLNEPLIVPFTVKSEVEVPNTSYKINENGEFILTWDVVEGADSYNIYNMSKIELLETSNKAVSGAESGYKSILRKVGTVKGDKTEFYQEDNNIVTFKGTKNETVISQNTYVKGDYFVTAVKDGVESNFTQAVSTTKLVGQIPYKVLTEKIGKIEKEEDLPKELEVQYVDGSTGMKEVVYNGVDEYGNPVYNIKGTLLKGSISVNFKATKEDLEKVNEEEIKKPKATNIDEAEDKTKQIPEKDLPTIIESEKTEDKKEDNKKDKEDKKEENKKDDIKKDDEKKNEDKKDDKNKDSNKEESLVDKQKENTEKHIEEGNKETVAEPEILKGMNDLINADSAAEEYIALKMIAGETKINLQAFPELQSASRIFDTALKVTYQNPLILGIKSYQYDYKTMTLIVEYKEDIETVKKKQEEIIKAANDINKKIIKKGMSDEEKRKAIYDYLNDNAKYQDEVLETAAKTNYTLSEADEKKYVDAFSTYGILVKKVGVCASYAASFQILADMAGLESIVVTGTVDGVGHAWNKVKIGNEWYNTDSTNNETNSGIPYMYYQTPDEVAKKNGLREDEYYWIDNELSNFKGVKKDYDYYYIKKLEVNNKNELLASFKKQYKDGNKKLLVRMDNTISGADIRSALSEFVTKDASKYQNTAMYWTLGNYILLSLEGDI